MPMCRGNFRTLLEQSIKTDNLHVSTVMARRVKIILEKWGKIIQGNYRHLSYNLTIFIDDFFR